MDDSGSFSAKIKHNVGHVLYQCNHQFTDKNRVFVGGELT